MLVAARDAKVKRLVFAGSSSVYGNSPVLPKREDMRPNPLSPYALQKLVGEQYCQMFTQLYGLETVTTRYFNVFGPRQQPGSPYSGVISLFIEALVAGRAPMVHGDGRQTRDFTYVGDVVTGVLAVLRSAEGRRRSDQRRGRRTRVAARVDPRAAGDHSVTKAEPVFGPTREGDVRDSQADIFKARQLLNFEPGDAVRRGPAPDRRVVPRTAPTTRADADRPRNSSCPTGLRAPVVADNCRRHFLGSVGRARRPVTRAPRLPTALIDVKLAAHTA